MASSQDLPTRDEWDDWFAKQLDVALRTTAIPQQAPNSSADYLFEEISAHDVGEGGRHAVGHTSVGGDGTDSSVMDVMQYERPQAVRPWRDGAGMRVGRKNNSFNNLDISAISPKTVPLTPAGAIDHRQQRSGKVHPGTHPVWMGRDYWLDGFGRATTVGPAPALRYTGSSNVQLPSCIACTSVNL